jgi:hypothetical protein
MQGVYMKTILREIALLAALCGVVIALVILGLFVLKPQTTEYMVVGIVLCSVTTLVVCLGYSLRFKHPSNIARFFAVLAFNFCFFIVIPATIERSLSVFMLSELAKYGRLTPAEISDLFRRDYIDGRHAIEKRIVEQIGVGNLREEGGGVCLTPRGEVLVTIFRLTTRLFSVPQPRVMMAGNVDTPVSGVVPPKE